MIALTVEWRDRWHWWHAMYPSAYAKGEIAEPRHRVTPVVAEIYRHKKSGQIRVYSDYNLDGRLLRVNGERRVTLRPRGRHGRLYLGFEEE